MRRMAMRTATLVIATLVLTTADLSAVSAASTTRAAARGQGGLPACEWCGADEAPADLTWDIRVAGADEPGERLTISGTVYQSDGRTPAPGVILYLYHTNRDGVYPKRGDETGNGRRHGYLRGWLRTDERGRYRFSTIRPRSYPGGSEPAHIHVTVKAPGGREDYIDDFIFEGDPLITPSYQKRLRKRGGSGLVSLARNERGIWTASRDIILGTPAASGD